MGHSEERQHVQERTSLRSTRSLLKSNTLLSIAEASERPSTSSTAQDSAPLVPPGGQGCNSGAAQDTETGVAGGGLRDEQDEGSYSEDYLDPDSPTGQGTHYSE